MVLRFAPHPRRRLPGLPSRIVGTLGLPGLVVALVDLVTIEPSHRAKSRWVQLSDATALTVLPVQVLLEASDQRSDDGLPYV